MARIPGNEMILNKEFLEVVECPILVNSALWRLIPGLYLMSSTMCFIFGLCYNFSIYLILEDEIVPRAFTVAQV